MPRIASLRWSFVAAIILTLAATTAALFDTAGATDAPATITKNLGGDTSRPVEGPTAFTFPAANLLEKHQRDFFFGNRLFNTNWVIAPASVKSFDGLGPMFNRVSCDSCHTQDGRGRPPLTSSEPMDSMLIRMSVQNTAFPNGTAPHPVYGDQLSEQSISGVAPEGKTKITREIIKGVYSDGAPFQLEKPTYTIEELGYGVLGEDVVLSPRVAQQVIGLGLLEAVPETILMANADPDDTNDDGISGRPNRVFDPVTGSQVIGRFGWKANQPNLISQNASAAIGDMGITSPLFPIENCSSTQVACLASPIGGNEVDLSQKFLDKLTLYTRLLSVPMQRDRAGPTVVAGEKLFSQMGCSACHIPTLTTDKSAPLPELMDQTFHPFTDLLLHDMGLGLADNRPDGLATGTEWRTAPLWGVGHFVATNGHQRLMHDGRARGPAEAILWHGGEAERSKEVFQNAPKSERDALIAFLNSL